VSRKVVALVGCGRWGAKILRDLVALGCETPVVARSEESRARALAGGAQVVVPEIGRLPEVDGVVVATTTIAHGEVVEATLGLGAPVFVEKPLTADIASAERLAALASGRVFVMDKWRYHPGVELLAEIARAQELGPVVGLRTTRTGWGHSFADVDTVWIHAPHDLAIGLEVLGFVPAVRAAVGEFVGPQLSGVVAILGEEPWQGLEVSTSSHERRREIRLLCQDGTAWLEDGYADHVGVARADAVGAEPERRPISTELPLLRELRVFVEHLDGGPPPRSSVEEGAEIVRRIAELRALAGAGA
jgi:predicted dehydrogenase